VLLVAAIASWFFPQQILTVDSGDVKADVIVVLGGTTDRPHRAAELFKTGAAPNIICSGAGDADGFKRVLKRDGVPAQFISLESKSRTTRENAELTVPLLRQMNAKHVIIVTSWYHSRRALRCFEHFAPDIKFYSRPAYSCFARTDWKRTGVLRYIRWEYLKLPGYWLRYGICPF